jgi:DNA-binding NtrC family response regulator
VTIASEVGRGTTVIIYLPLTKSKPVADDAGVAGQPDGRSHTILVVEDEASVRSTVRRQLETLGHKVLVADTAAAALPILEGRASAGCAVDGCGAGHGMNGIDLAEAASVFKPGLPVIFMSGFTAVPEAQKRIRTAARRY